MNSFRSAALRGVETRIAAVALALLAVAPWALADAASAATLERVKETGHIRLGYRADARPISFKDDSGAAAGYAVDLCLRVVEAVKGELGIDQVVVDWIPVAAETRFGAVQRGEVDLICGADSATLARRKEVSFSIPIFAGGVGALVRADASERLTDALAGQKPEQKPIWRANAGQFLLTQKFAVVGGTTAEYWAAGKGAELDLPFAVTTVPNYEEGLKSLLNGKADVFFGDRVLLLDAARSQVAKQVRVHDRQFTVEPLALALSRGDEDFRLIVDRALSWIYNNGKAAELYAKWFGKTDEATLAFFRTTAIPE